MEKLKANHLYLICYMEIIWKGQKLFEQFFSGISSLPHCIDSDHMYVYF